MPRETAAEKRHRLALQETAKQIYTAGSERRSAMQTEPDLKPGVYRHWKGQLYQVYCIAIDMYIPEFVVVYSEVDRDIPPQLPRPGSKETIFVVQHSETEELLGVYWDYASQKWWISHDRYWQQRKYAVVGWARPLDSFTAVLEGKGARFQFVGEES